MTLLVATAACSSGQKSSPDDARAPVVVKRVNPDYPAALRVAGVEGWVKVAGTVPKEGGVLRDARVVESSDSRLDALALAAVARWEWKPATRNGEPVDVLFTTTVNFSLHR